jgi:hypothetical protein
VASTPDLNREPIVTWDRYKDKSPSEALDQIYRDAQTSSATKRNWYWTKIKVHRWWSRSARGWALALLVLGTALPLVAGLSDNPSHRLACTQGAIIILAVAGLIQVADKTFGWSSGWTRYITTATAMGNATDVFDMAWSKHLISKTTPLDASDMQTLFALAEQLERDLIKLVSDETNGWITEFNAGINLLDAVIKTQREDTQKQLDALRTASLKAQEDAKTEGKAREAAAAAAAKAKEPGMVDLMLTFKGEPKPVTIMLDGTVVVQEFLGTAWSSPKLAPGLHTIGVRSIGDTKHDTFSSTTVEAGKIVRLELKLSV